MEKIAVAPWESLVLSGLSRDKEAAQKTSRNKICNGTFPFATREIGGKKVVLVADILSALGVTAPASAATQTDATATSKKRGRRTNAEKAADKAEVQHD